MHTIAACTEEVSSSSVNGKVVQGIVIIIVQVQDAGCSWYNAVVHWHTSYACTASW